MALSFFITPKGSMCGINIIPQLQGTKILFGQNVESFGSVLEAQAYLNSVLNSIQKAYSGGSPSTNVILDLRIVKGYLITGIYPRTVTMAWSGSAPQELTSATQVQVFGLGFTPATVGFLFLEDATGGPDSNGFFLRLIYVSPTQLVGDGTGNTGDAHMDANVQVYYQDISGVQSNILTGVSATTGGPASSPVVVIV